MGLTVLSLNVWNGRQYHDLREYLKRQSAEVDVFCLQEACDSDTDIVADFTGRRVNLLQELEGALDGFQGYFAAERYVRGAIDGKTDRQSRFLYRTGIAMFVRRTLPLLSPPVDVFIFGEYNEPVRIENKYRTPFRPQRFIVSSPRTLQYVVIEYGGESYLIYNFHGLWDGGPKVDTSERLAQSQCIREVLTKHPPHKKVFVGDFNLNPETASLAMIEEAGGFRNLVFEYGIGTTRSILYKERDRNPFADYALVTDDVRVRAFNVPKVAVSDHLPLIVYIDDVTRRLPRHC